MKEILGKYKHNPIIVLINGKAGVGKDTFVKKCWSIAPMYDEYPIGVLSGHRSDKPKELLRQLGWDGEKTGEVRSLLKQLVDFGEEHHNLSKKDIMGMINDTKKAGITRSVIFYHVRRPDVIDSLKNTFKKDHNVMTLLIRRPVDNVELDNWGIENYPYDIAMLFADMDDSKIMAETFMEEIHEYIVEGESDVG